jgi:hypothetical protein
MSLFYLSCSALPLIAVGAAFIGAAQWVMVTPYLRHPLAVLLEQKAHQERIPLRAANDHGLTEFARSRI